MKTIFDTVSRRQRYVIHLIAICFAGIAATANAESAAIENTVLASWGELEVTQAEYANWLYATEMKPGRRSLDELIVVRSFSDQSHDVYEELEQQALPEIYANELALLANVLAQMTMDDINVTESDIDAFYNENKDRIGKPPRLKLRNIYRILPEDPKAAELVKTEMEKARKDIASLEDFKRVATEISESQTRYKEGLLGLINPAEVAAPIRNAIVDLQPGEMSEIVKHRGGLSLFFCESIAPARRPPMEKVRAQIQKHLRATQVKQRWEEIDREISSNPPQSARYRPNIAFERPVEVPAVEELTLADKWRTAQLRAAEAERRGYTQLPQVKSALDWIRQRAIVNAKLRQDAAKSVGTLTEPQLKELYESHSRQFAKPAQYRLRGIQLPLDASDDVTAAQRLYKQLQTEPDTFARVAEKHSIHSTSDQQGNLGWLSTQQLISWSPTLNKAIKSQKIGALIGPMRLKNELWIFLVEDEREARLPTFDEAAPQLRAQWRSTNERRAMQTLKQQQLEQLNVQYSESNLVTLSEKPS